MNLSPSITARLQFQHQTVEELIDRYNEDQLKTRTVPDKWSPFENIVHLVTYQLVFQQRIGEILKENNHLFERYVAEKDPLFTEYLKQPLRDLLQNLHEVRKQVFQQLHDLSPGQLSMAGRHPKYGTLTLVHWIEFFLLHEAHHLFTLFKLLSERRES